MIAMDELTCENLTKAWESALPKDRRRLIVTTFADAHSVFINRGNPTDPTPKKLLVHAYHSMCAMLCFLQENGDAREFVLNAFRDVEQCEKSIDKDSRDAQQQSPFEDDEEWAAFVSFERRLLKSYDLPAYQVDHLIRLLTHYRDLLILHSDGEIASLKSFENGMGDVTRQICNFAKEIAPKQSTKVLMTSGGLSAGGQLIKFANALGDCAFGTVAVPPFLTIKSVFAGEALTTFGAGRFFMDLYPMAKRRKN